MFVKCPKCGSPDVQPTNLGERAFARTCSTALTLLTFPLGKGGAIELGNKVYKNLCQSRNYICLNPKCKHMFEIFNR